MRNSLLKGRWFMPFSTALLIVSEAARKLGSHAEQLAPDQPWADIRSIGNVLRHQYDEIDPEVIWSIVQRDLASLKAAAQRAIQVLAADEPENQPPKS